MPLLSAASTSLLSGDPGGLSQIIPKKPRRCGSPVPPRASKDVPYSFRYPVMTKKPKWWWRALACLPYLMPLHEIWMYAETAYYLHPFLEDFKFLTYPFLGAIGRLPSWFLMAYFFVAYLGIVRKKEYMASLLQVPCGDGHVAGDCPTGDRDCEPLNTSGSLLE
ncbi:hypothetical protein L1049_003581 [Liquidambar formosana]|uniref:Protein TIC 20 n=1 Tax=Liquidambar formosana TaxID=63359 RepID=A0AAP0N8P3_LIQFO